mmetsp:Transcript_17943/g.22885  ORF Transcript_17943/g.22885 Transcript_17943/m.22885 type:complete len:279 (+) Transcript_17943:319-1155(+)|eukprot:CAMPEP_0204828112 /NCGR_PEP_ID=MMETSP1346-20131115/5744_1 /ASSEMBLY_ACC=CAM_ASM_000771 /TAXON_ID=215587 /ORGANISM="Aplanochytrium stocchinoi, Strain GSBS06" /LENGTH=278 /DNA_ID=CAMNT_0051956943 /DNA_START=193 /DNA_END=1029 /DNA_ORIENTATION=-
MRRSKRARKEVNYKEPSNPIFSEEEKGTEKHVQKVKDEGGEVENVKQYRQRLVKAKKELYKDPPVLPPTSTTGCRVLNGKMPPPTRNKETNALIFKDHPEFKPNLSPKEVLQLGSFGGTYFRSIDSAVLGRRISWKEALEDIPKDWLEGLDRATQLTNQHYDKDINKYKVKCGGSLGMWESSGWISSIDPYGWFQWYCRFFQGRRSTDDARQIGRAQRVFGPTGRFRTQLMNKVMNANANFDDYSISPVIRQSLQHWGYELTEECLAAHKTKRKSKGK